jgi:hypothetical protein
MTLIPPKANFKPRIILSFKEVNQVHPVFISEQEVDGPLNYMGSPLFKLARIV